jgi:sugar phosphate isomerase/epimerase
MKYALMEQFQMHHTETMFGISSSDKIELFIKAQQLGFDGIEFGLNTNYIEDPFWNGKGNVRKEMRKASQDTGVVARSLCLHLLNYDEYSPASPDIANRLTARQLIKQALEACHETGISVVLVPFFGTALLKSTEQIEHLITEISAFAAMAESYGICLGLETPLEAADNLAILERIASDTVQIYFDTANAVFHGYDVVQEILDLGSKIVQAHVKDHPETPVLGKGEIEFQRVAQAFHKVGFDDYLVLELPTSDDAATKANLSYIKSMIEKGE